MKDSEKLKNLKTHLESLLAELDSLEEENFDKKIVQINSKISTINNLKKELNIELSEKVLSFYSKDMGKTAKQIKQTFDNKANEIKEKQSIISKELKNLNNQKKLAIYR